MNRRDAVLALAALGATPLGALAQPPGRVWRVGVLSPLSRAVALDPLFIGAFPQGMRDLGYVEGKSLLLEWRFADGDAGRLPALAAELAALWWMSWWPWRTVPHSPRKELRRRSRSS